MQWIDIYLNPHLFHYVTSSKKQLEDYWRKYTDSDAEEGGPRVETDVYIRIPMLFPL